MAMTFALSLTAATHVQGGIQVGVAIASLITASLLHHSHRLDPATVPPRSLARLVASFGISSLCGVLLALLEPRTSGFWLLVAVQGAAIGLIAHGLWQLRRFVRRPLPARPDPLHRPEQDALTGLPNWQGLALAFEHIRTYYVGGELEHTLLLVQADGIVAMQTYGPYAGDTALLLIAQILQDKTRTLDLVARVGDTRFGILLAGCPLSGGMIVAEVLRDAIASLQLPNLNRPACLSAAIGAVPFSQDSTLETSWHQAEQALALAQKTGKGQVAVPPTLQLLPLSVAYEAPEIGPVAGNPAT